MNHADIRNKQRHDQVMKADEFMAELFETNTMKMTKDDMEFIYEFVGVLILQKKFFTCHKKCYRMLYMYVYSFMCKDVWGIAMKSVG